MTNIKYICHCNNCGDEFWVNKDDTADEIQCPTCKKKTPLIVKGTACPVPDAICTCEVFKEAITPGSCQECYLPAINKGKIGVIQTPINFCPWCGKKVKRDEDNH